MSDKVIICTSCFVPHVENCNTCFGFGLYLGKDGKTEVPTNASSASKWKHQTYIRCKECGGTPFGIRPQQTADQKDFDRFLKMLLNREN